ncbi:MAG TPA: hypothetical protein VJ957_07755 [Longimicrobiales bacterium]|nr:hypothetical protein [Longimicrobiales bacterium]
MKNGRKAVAALASMALALVTLAGCSDSTSPAGATQVSIGFTAAGATLPASGVMVPLATPPQGQPVAVQGTNGTLEIDSLYVIVSSFELKTADHSSCEESSDACEEFKAPPSFVDVPLNSAGTVTVNQDVPAGTYDRLKFKIENGDWGDESDSAKAQQIQTVMQQVLAQFPDWPQSASMLVIGTFTPTGGQAVPFHAYFAAEVEVEMPLNPPVTVDANSGATQLTVKIQPDTWFSKQDGTIMDLSQYDFATTGQVVEFEVEMEHGFAEVDD